MRFSFARPMTTIESMALTAQQVRSGADPGSLEADFPEVIGLMLKADLLAEDDWASARETNHVPAALVERVLRVARIVGIARDTFGDRSIDWLFEPNAALGGAPPMSFLDTELGARAVETLLGRIDHGIAA